MLLTDLLTEDNKAPTLQPGDVIIIKNKGGSFATVVGEINDEIAYVYDYDSRKKVGTIILKYVHQLPSSSKHSRKELARHIGFKSNDDTNASRFEYVDKQRVKTNYEPGT